MYAFKLIMTLLGQAVFKKKIFYSLYISTIRLTD